MNPDIFLQAAKWVDTGDQEFTCNAIRLLSRRYDDSEEFRFYCSLFKPDDRRSNSAWLSGCNSLLSRDGNILDWFKAGAPTKALRQLRVMMLLFAYEVAKDEA